MICLAHSHVYSEPERVNTGLPRGSRGSRMARDPDAIAELGASEVRDYKREAIAEPEPWIGFRGGGKREAVAEPGHWVRYGTKREALAEPEPWVGFRGGGKREAEPEPEPGRGYRPGAKRE
jgi:hypothetical protein